MSTPRSISHRAALSLCRALLLIGIASGAVAQNGTDAAREVVSFDAAFFERYQPNTALDMVQRLPGFLIDDGGDQRGFGAATGNILINDRYPSVKQDAPTDILERIAATQVERIDLIRAQVRDIDLRGQAVVASVILRGDIPATGRYEVAVRKNFNLSPVTIRSAVSVADNWGAIDYIAGLTYRSFNSAEDGPELITAFDGTLLEARSRNSRLSGDEGELNLGMFTWLGETAISVNTQLGFEDRVEPLRATTIDLAPAPQTEDFFIDDDERLEFEIGGDAERRLSDALLSKAIVVYQRGESDNISSQRRLDPDGSQSLFRVATSKVVESEAILRSETTWTPLQTRSVNINVEGARNTIDGTLEQTVDTGAGPLPVPVPGANTRVEEDRIDALIFVTEYRDRFEFAYGLGAETSTIRQQGDASLRRRFTFLKPQFLVVYSPTQRRQTRFRITRDVSQLDFNDFVSSTVFQDDDLALGNPDLEPQSTWVVEFSEERRFGELGVFRGTLFYNEISDVEDLLPLSDEFEAPGNIGDGWRYGIRLDATLPLEPFGLRGGRLDIDGRWQRSNVSDPVTGLGRRLSGEAEVGKPLTFEVENRYNLGIALRQDLQAQRLSWGAEIRKRDDRLSFRVNELIRYRERAPEINVFAETTTMNGLRIRVEGNNLLDFEQVRFRDIYLGRRSITPLDVTEARTITDGRRLIVSVSGSF